MLSEKEVELMEHSLGIRQNNGVSYRNYFNTGPGSDDYAVCEELVLRGLMRKHTRDFVPGFIYCVTGEGKEALGARGMK